jgi:GNAT superfamily N-acetyltransferase
LDHPTPDQFGFLALLDSTPVGFAFAFPHANARWGTNLDNLHVCPTGRGGGIGTHLLCAVTTHVLRHHPGDGLCLCAYARNIRPRADYERLGAQQIERAAIVAPGGGIVAE